MKKVLIVVLLAIIFLGPNAQAATPVHYATVLPGGLLYNFKILGESIWQKVVSVRGPEAEMNYVSKRINNRAEEILTLIDNGSFNSTAYIKAVGKFNQLKSNFVALLAKVQESRRLEAAKRGTVAFLNDFSDDYPGLMLQKMSDVRQQVLDAQKAGDTEKAFKLVTTLKELKRVYTETNVAFTVSWVFDEEEINQTEGVLTGADKLAYALDWADQHKHMLAETSRGELYDASDKELLIKAIKKVDGLIIDLQKIPLDQAGGEKVDAVFGPARAALNDIALAIRQKDLKDSLANQLPEEITQLTPPDNTTAQDQNQTQQSTQQTQSQNQQPTTQNSAPAQSKPKLKIIPSESIQKNPLTLYWFKGIRGNVGSEYASFFSARGGLPPYHFQLATGVGFPPHQIILDLNGKLSGIPSAEGKYVFGVCAVDTAGHSSCMNDVTITIGPAAAVQVTSRQCTPTKDFFNSPSSYSGTAVTDVDGYLSYGSMASFDPFAARMNNFSTLTCDSWSSHTLSDGVVKKNVCVRGPNDPATTNWTVSSPMSLTENNDTEITSYVEVVLPQGGNEKVAGLYCP